MFYQKEIETMHRGEIEALQLAKLKKMVDYCYNNVPFYHDRLSAAGVTGDKIKMLSDIQYIPLTTKDDVRDHYPFGLLAQPMKKIVRSLRNHRDLILNWFRARGTVSAGAVEGLNNKAKLTTRKAYGFRTYEAIEIESLAPLHGNWS